MTAKETEVLARRARLFPVGLAVFALTALAACAKGGGAGELGVEMELAPTPPRVGDTRIELALEDAEGEPLRGADVRVEANMDHAGMVPEFADAEETEPGRYVADLELTMGGDWYFVITATTRDGERLEQVIDVPGVSSEATPGGP